MNIQVLLTIGTIGLPIIGALLLWRWGNEYVHAQRRGAAITLGVTGLLALILFLNACVFLTDRLDCTYARLYSISVCLLCVVLVFVSVLRESNERHDYSFMLLLSSTFAGLVLTLKHSWVMSLFSLSLLLIVVGRWVRARGSSVSYFFSRHEYNPDYQDDERPKDYQNNE